MCIQVIFQIVDDNSYSSMQQTTSVLQERAGKVGLL